MGGHDVLVHAAGGRLVAVVGLGDVIVVDTPDALLVVAQGRRPGRQEGRGRARGAGAARPAVAAATARRPRVAAARGDPVDVEVALDQCARRREQGAQPLHRGVGRRRSASVAAIRAASASAVSGSTMRIAPGGERVVLPELRQPGGHDRAARGDPRGHRAGRGHLAERAERHVRGGQDAWSAQRRARSP